MDGGHLKRLLLLLLSLPFFGFSGDGGIWIQAAREYYSFPYAGTQSGLDAGDAHMSNYGIGQIGPGLEALTIPAYRAGTIWIWQRYDAYRIYGPPFEVLPRGIRQMRVDSIGVHADSSLTCRVLSVSQSHILAAGSGPTGHLIPDASGTDYNFLLDNLGQSPTFGTVTQTRGIYSGNVDLSNSSYVRVKDTGGSYQQVMGAASSDTLKFFGMKDDRPIDFYNHGGDKINLQLADSGCVSLPNGPLAFRTEQTLPDNATPTVFNGNLFVCSPASPVTITNFSRGFDGQRISIRFTNANATINNAGNFVLQNGAFISANASVLVLQRRNSLWYEESRSPISSTGGPIVQAVYCSTGTLDFDLTSAVSQDLTLTVTGAAVGDIVTLGVPNGSAGTTVQYTGWVSSANTVTIRAEEATTPSQTKTIILPNQDMLPAPTLTGNNYIATSWAGNAVTSAYMMLPIPEDFGAIVNWKINWTSSSASDAAQVIHRVGLYKMNAGTVLPGTYTDGSNGTDNAPGVALQVVTTTCPNPAVTFAVGDLVMLRCTRDGVSDASTFASNFLGASMTYTTAAGENPASGTFRATVLHY